MTAQNDDAIRMLAYNYQRVSDCYDSDKEIDIYQKQNYIFDKSGEMLQVIVSDINNGFYKATFHVVDHDNGSGSEVLKRLTQINETMVDFMKKIYCPRIIRKKLR